VALTTHLLLTPGSNTGRTIPPYSLSACLACHVTASLFHIIQVKVLRGNKMSKFSFLSPLPNSISFDNRELAMHSLNKFILRYLLILDNTQRILVVDCRRFDATYRFHLMGPEITVTKYQSTLPDIKEENRSNLHSSGSLKSRTSYPLKLAQSSKCVQNLISDVRNEFSFVRKACSLAHGLTSQKNVILTGPPRREKFKCQLKVYIQHFILQIQRIATFVKLIGLFSCFIFHVSSTRLKYILA
jgi:hypothetical protein